MTTITREQQKQILIDTANHVISRDNTSPYSENLRELARIALASLEAEPVAYIFKHPAGELFWSLTDESNKGQNDVMPVYAAPPAPVVPDEMATSDDMNLYQKSFAQGYNACRAAMLQGAEPVSNRDELQVIGWLRSDYNSDDKRDPNAPLFMLGSNDPSEAWGVKYIPLSGNSSAIPDGWIICSERMPEDEQEVIVHNKLGYRYVSYFDEHSGLFFDMRGGNQMNCIEHILVTHWMPLPAAPQQ